MTFFQVLWIFFLCSVLGWAAEIALLRGLAAGE